MNFIADTGFIVLRWSKNVRRRQCAIRLWEKATLPILTSAANLQEAAWLLENSEIVLRMVKDGDLNPALDFNVEGRNLHALTQKLAPRMDVADAAIMRLSEIYPHHEVLTTDRNDFEFYRRNRFEIIPCIFPPA